MHSSCAVGMHLQGEARRSDEVSSSTHACKILVCTVNFVAYLEARFCSCPWLCLPVLDSVPGFALLYLCAGTCRGSWVYCPHVCSCTQNNLLCIVPEDTDKWCYYYYYITAICWEAMPFKSCIQMPPQESRTLMCNNFKLGNL